ncbi:SsrA-binding protein [candidate division WWE3 bacterium CG08_land_8_20_14_0_20_43_13]|uniref:SsrA-binding protein n=1 Tax=candidate division WWE3 bacterium CG08_land_8_20_14_0_20_43_13 TaxID=1975087 RepID=A0A2H0X7K7_UNCKA|nr:MAG: SsrA-binding protein [candidate division WWE3 bacterium CG08_land_8_20_14_0_20_43_13]
MEQKILAQNKKAYFDYSIGDTYIAGLVLFGPEVKSAREGGAKIVGAYLSFSQNEAFILGLHIRPYSHTRYELNDPDRPKKLLLNAKEIKKLNGVASRKGVSIIPLELFAQGRLLKLKIGIGVGKKNYDKREALKKKSVEKRLRHGESAF